MTKRNKKTATFQIRYFGTFELVVSLVESKIKEIWQKACETFDPVDIKIFSAETSSKKKTFLTLVAIEIHKLSLQLTPNNHFQLKEKFIKKHPWYSELEKSGLFSIDHWPCFYFYPEDFSIKTFKENDYEPF